MPHELIAGLEASAVVLLVLLLVPKRASRPYRHDESDHGSTALADSSLGSPTRSETSLASNAESVSQRSPGGQSRTTTS